MKDFIAIANALGGSLQTLYFLVDNNASPKQYGQWLQSNGRQKWNIKNKK